MALRLYTIFFVSGAAGLLFETLWFRVLGLTLGNSVWASNIVLASFMAGLAAGNALAARHGQRLRRPVQIYAAVESVVAITGIAIVVLLPPASSALARIFVHVGARPWILNLARLGVAFSLLLAPAAAMGLTLPLLAQAITGRDANFGRVLGRLYGWNTLGAVAGAMGGELWLVGALGLRGTALVAGGLDLAAAGAALVLVTTPAVTGPPAPATARPPDGQSWRLLAAAGLAGATLLALEVIWFRFLQLFVYGTSLIFAAMLAVVLSGIGLGGVLAGFWLGRDRRAQRFVPLVALAAALSVELSYALFDPRVGGAAYTTDNTAAAFVLFVRLMAPTAVLSGMLFTLLGAAQRERCATASETAGKLTLANTLGAMVGALLAGFVLLPGLGMEKALFAAMLSYGVIGGLTLLPAVAVPARRRARGAVLALFALAALVYPFGLMRRHFIPQVIARYTSGEPELVDLREGQMETVMVLRSSYRGQPLHHRLMTNGHSMSATTFRGRRYMKLYVYWALAVHPDARKALLISYGVGSTAKALTNSRQLSSIDVVDISRDVLAAGPVAFPGQEPPLSDPRVRVHVEDGRFFLEATDERFDLITAEPPPLRGAGITSLYSREYFQLVHDRLRPGGVVTYWLPVNQLWLSESKAILRGFCAAFPDCTLWSGAGLQWMLAGTRGARGPVPEERFSAQWRDPVVAGELADLGFEAPEWLGATFLADATTIAEWTRGAAVLDDDHPGRILPRYPRDENGDPTYRAWMQPRAIRERFATSAFIRALWPPSLREKTLNDFAPEAVLDDLCVWRYYNPIEALHGVLTLSSLHTLPLLLMGTEPAVQQIAVPLYASGARDAGLELELGARDMAERDYQGAERHLALVNEGPRVVQARLLRTLALALSGRLQEARRCLDTLDFGTLTPVQTYSAEWLERFLYQLGKRPAPGPDGAPTSAAGPG